MSIKDLDNYLQRNPVYLPERENNYTCILLSDSKASRLEKLPDNLPELPLIYLYRKGGSASDLFRLIQSKLCSIQQRYNKPCYVYVWAGTCDITRKTSSGKVILNTFGDSSVEEIVSVYRKICDFVLENGGRIQFIGVPTYSVSIYNKWLGKGSGNEEREDAEINRQVTLLNHKIIELNKTLGKITLKFNADLVKCRTNRQKTNFALLSDGLHPSSLLARKWLRRLQLNIIQEVYDREDSIVIDQQEFIEFALHNGN